MIRFALIVASTLGFLLTAAMGNLMVPLLRSLQNRNRPAQTQQAPGPDVRGAALRRRGAGR